MRTALAALALGVPRGPSNDRRRAVTASRPYDIRSADVFAGGDPGLAAVLRGL